ncbi:MAG: hypothetical protein GY847_23375 [Proteobacteria bacterium]|nr:hypothetical protein [Pseudomonadota bacterium]
MTQTNKKIDTSRISITAYHTGYTWYINNLSDEIFATFRGKLLYNSLIPFGWIKRNILGQTDVSQRLLQRHLIIDHLLEQGIEEAGIEQVLEIGAGFTPRGFRFKKHKGYKNLRYVEADLPDMIHRKTIMLKKANLLGKDHSIVACSVLADEGDLSLTNIMQEHLDPNLPTAVITEGLIGYFDLAPMEKMWKRIANQLKVGSGGFYLCNSRVINTKRRFQFLESYSNLATRILSRGKLHTHWGSEDLATSSLKNMGYDKVEIYSPESLCNIVPIPRSREPEPLRIIRAWVEK